MALSKEQFSELRKKGLSVQQIVSFEKGEKPRMSGGQFTVPAPQEDRQNKIARYQQEANVAQEEAKKANSIGGFLGNFGKAVVGTVANSEVGLGKSMAKIFDRKTPKILEEASQGIEDQKVRTLQAIRKAESEGRDATRLKQSYNQLVSDPSTKEVQSQFKEATTMPSTSEVVGQLGGTALDILTAGTYGQATKAMTTGSRFVQPSVVKNVAGAVGLPELGSLAKQKAGGFFSKQGAKNMAVGTGIGYASDVTQGLQGARGEERTGAQAFIPGAGTALGFGIPALSEANQTRKNVFTPEGRDAQTAIKRRGAIDDIEKKDANVGKAFAMGDKKGVDVRSILSETNLLNGAVDEDGLVSAERALANFDSMVEPYESKVRDAIRKEGAKVRIDDVANAMDEFMSGTGLQGNASTRLSSELLGDLKGLEARYGKNIPVEALHDIKVFRGNASNYSDTSANVINKDATRFFKELVEKNVRSIDVQKYNGELSKLYTVRDAIEVLNRKRVKGGRAGKYFSSVIGTGVGASSGNPLLAVLGAEVGSKTQGAILGRSFGGDISKDMEIPGQLTDVLTKQASGKDIIPPVVLPKKANTGTLDLQSSKSDGSLKTNQSTTNAPTKNVIPPTVLPVKDASTKKSTGKVLKREGGEAFAGGFAGVEKDEEGNWTINEEKALAGMVGVAGLTRSQAIQKLSKNLDSTMRTIFVDFIDVVRSKAVVTKAGKLTFTSKEAEKKFMEGIKFINGSAGSEMELGDIADSAPTKIADFFEDLVAKAKKANGDK
jgi:hypothetical protein